jgi:hypothetical protein
MEAVAHPRAGEPGVAPALQQRHLALRADRGKVEHRVVVVVFGHDLTTADLAHRIQRNDDRLLPRQRLQLVEQVVQADPPRLALAGGRALVVPGGPGRAAPRQHGGVGMQHGVVRLVADRAQHRGLGRAGVAQQRERLVGMGGQHHVVEALGAGVGGHRNAGA